MHQKYSALYFPFKLIIFYLVGLNLWRFVFIFHNDNNDIILPSFYGFNLDLSMACGAMLIALVPWILYLVFGKMWLLFVSKWISFIIWFFVCLVEFGSVLIYSEWGTTLDARAIGYLNHFSEAWASSKDFVSWKVGFFGLLILFVGFKRLGKQFEHWQPVRSSYIQSAVFLFLIGPLLFLGVRGGLQKLPIKPSDAFYGKDMKSNFAAVNKVWYLLYSLKHKTEMNILHSDIEIELFWKEYKKTTCLQDTVEISLKNKNIVVIITEGWSADLVRYMGGREKITPFFDSISEKSIRFTNAFSTGFRTDQGLMSVLSGIPSVASLNMPNQLDKVMKYPSSVQDFKNAGYKTSFV